MTMLHKILVVRALRLLKARERVPAGERPFARIAAAVMTLTTRIC